MILETDVSRSGTANAPDAHYDYDEGSADFSDCYIAEINKAKGAETTVSFDECALEGKGLVRRAN